MEATRKNVERLQSLFDDAWDRIVAGERSVGVSCGPDYKPNDEEFWTLYMNSLDCLILDEEDLLENFDEMVNFGSSVRERVCLKNPCNTEGFILVDKGLAEKILVLGALA